MLDVDCANESSKTCWVCGVEGALPWKSRSLDRSLVPGDMRITDAHYGRTLALVRCTQCGFIFACDNEINDLTALYEALDDPEYEDTNDTRVLQMQWLLDLALREHPTATSALDIGAGTGLLVSEAKRRGLEAVGVEPSHALVEAAARVNQCQLLQGIFPHDELQGSKFDIVFLVDVIEHVANPVELLQACHDTLAPNGVLIIVTPDVRSIAARLLGRRWWHFRLAHVGYFGRHSLTKAMGAAGLVPARWRRAKWFFHFEYLAERLGEYLWLGWWNRGLAKIPPCSLLSKCVVPLNLHDSWVTICRSNSASPKQGTPE